MNDLGAGAALFLVVLPLVYLALFVALVALGTLVARRVWRWDERREQARRAAPLPPPQL
jgi:Flp pilus assembly protein TadB